MLVLEQILKVALIDLWQYAQHDITIDIFTEGSFHSVKIPLYSMVKFWVC